MHPFIWVGLIILILSLLAVDLLVFQKKAHTVELREAIIFTCIWVFVAVLFGVAIIKFAGHKAGLEYFGAYLIEFSLSVDNLFIFILLFTFFDVPHQYRHKVLFWGIIGAIILRFAFIILGIGLVRRFEWLLYVFGVILIYSGYKLFIGKEQTVSVDKNPILKFIRRFFPVFENYSNGQFFMKKDGELFVSPLFVCLLIVETTDVMFAVDSIPAVFGITLDPFIAFSSNAFAVLGLRSVYFAISNLLELIKYLHYGLAVLLIFIGIKMIIGHFLEIPIIFTLGFIGITLFFTVVLSFIKK